jgi:hypothetical protein
VTILLTYLPGFIANTVDGGLNSPPTPSTKKTLVLGTAGQGPANVAYPVTDPAIAAADYGLGGDLISSMEMVRSYCDNITLYRLGAKPGTLTGVGLDNTAGNSAVGYTIRVWRGFRDCGHRLHQVPPSLCAGRDSRKLPPRSRGHELAHCCATA